MKTEFGPHNLPVKSPPPRQRGLTFSPKSTARPENEEIESSPEVQRDINRTFSLCQTRQVKGNPTRERGLRSHARRNCTANLTPTTRPMNWLLGEKNAVGTPGEPFIITPPPPAARSTLINRKLHYLEEAMKITKAWPAEEAEAVRKGFADARFAHSKRAKDGDDEWETPSATQKPRREGLGEGLARNGKKPAAGRCGHGRSRKRATRTMAFQCSEHT